MKSTGSRVGFSMLLALVAANCAGPQALDPKANKYGVSASPRVVAEGDPIPKGGGRAMIGKPYVVGGRTYVPTGGVGFKREGWASWYGTAFHGRLTANGEIFDRGSVAAASPTLPLPSYVRVTNVVNKRSMIVRVNDRGPYERDRLIDVSERVAHALDFHRKGTTRVRVEYLGKASVKGSDDEMLLSTLTLDGRPASFGGGPIMLADLRGEPAPRARVPVAKPAERIVVAAAEAQDEAVAGPAAEPAVEATEPVRVATAAPEAPAPAAAAEVEDETVPVPPRRPVAFGGVPEAEPLSRPRARPVATVALLPPQRPAPSRIN